MTNSKRIVAALMAHNPEIQNKGFARTVAKLSDSVRLHEVARSILPDAFAITSGEVIIYEVADTNPIRASKAYRLAELDDELDDAGYRFRVVMLDYTGATIGDTPGWAYLPAYTDSFASPECMDYTPAAKAVMRAGEGAPESTPESRREAIQKLQASWGG